MFSITILLLFINLTVENKAEIISQKTNLLLEVIDDFLKQSAAINLYFCEKTDAKSVLKYISYKGFSMNSIVLDKVNSTKHIDISPFEQQLIQIFLDLNCKQGIRFLEQSWMLFNSSYSWLLWTPDYNQTMDQLQLSRVLVDSSVTLAQVDSNSVTLYDVHKVHHSLPFTITQLKYWTLGGTIYHLDQPKPRNNFMGANVICSVVIRELDYNQENFMELIMDPTYYPGVDVKRRFNIRMSLIVAEYYNFSLGYIYTSTWGAPDKNGTYNGMVGQVHRGDAEISCVYTLFFTHRTRAVDFFMSVSFARLSFFFLQPRTVGTYKALIVPLEPETWAALLITVLALSILMKIRRISEGSWSENLLVILSSISQQGAPENIESVPGKLFFLTVLIFSFFIAQYYNIAILSGLILPAPNAIQNWDQLMKSDLHLAVENDMFLRADLETNDRRSVQAKAKLLKSKEKFFTIDKGLEKVRKGGVALYTYILDHYGKIRATFSNSEICAMSEIGKVVGHIGPVGMENSPYKEHFRRIYQLLNENGIIKSQRNFWVPSKPDCQGNQETVVISAKALTIAFVVFAIGIMFALLIFIAEYRTGSKKKTLILKPFIH